MPSFANDVKNEIARFVEEKNCCRLSALAGLLRMGATVTLGAQGAIGINFTSENAAVARKVLKLLKSEGGFSTQTIVSRSRRLKKNNRYTVRVLPSLQGKALAMKLGLLPMEKENVALTRRPCCRAAYLRGAFLGGGSVNKPESSNHLEFSTSSFQLAKFLLTLLKRLDLPAKETTRRDHFIVYLKDGDAIIELLGIMAAEKAAERLEIARNVKEVRNQVNRLVNLETANLEKTISAAGRQVAAIKKLMGGVLWENLPESLKETAALRLAEPDATLSELSVRLNVGKSGLNHRLRKIIKLAGFED